MLHHVHEDVASVLVLAAKDDVCEDDHNSFSFTQRMKQLRRSCVSSAMHQPQVPQLSAAVTAKILPELDEAHAVPSDYRNLTWRDLSSALMQVVTYAVVPEP